MPIISGWGGKVAFYGRKYVDSSPTVSESVGIRIFITCLQPSRLQIGAKLGTFY